MIDGLTSYPALANLVERQLALWPKHETYLAKSFAGRTAEEFAVAEKISGLIFRLAPLVEGGVDALCGDYRYLCEDITLPEEIFFRRNNRYRLSSFEDANRECYSNAAVMTRYMNGLLLSNILWNNHARAFASYALSYLPSLPAGARHLEIGPGHGLFLYFAAEKADVASVTGWDISPASIETTRTALSTMGAGRTATLALRNLFDAPASGELEAFDSIVMSEILEHLEDPVAALRAARRLLRRGGRIWINVPANSPAPDHIYLLRAPEEACDLVDRAGLAIENATFFPMTGYTLDQAKKRSFAISCVVTARRDI